MAHIILPLATHSHTIIFMHGKGSTAVEFQSDIFESQASNDLTLPELFPGVKWVFPSAPLIRSTRFDCDMTQWFDMWSVEDPDEEWQDQVVDLSKSVQILVEIIKQEVSILGKASKVIVAGISQGAATAAHAVLQTECAGFVALSSWFALSCEVERIISEQTQLVDRSQRIVQLTTPGVDGLSREGLPVFLAHCADDDVLPVRQGERLKSNMENLGCNVEWHAYEDGGHWLSEPRGMDDLTAFICSIVTSA